MTPALHRIPPQSLFETMLSTFRSDLTGGPDLGDARAMAEARRNLIPFVQRMRPSYDPQPHHRRIADALEAIARHDINRVVITMPPRHGKTELASVHFPPWYLGNHPDERIIEASYGDSLVRRFSRRARNMMLDTRWPFPDVRPAIGSRAMNEWDIEGRMGGMSAVGVGGPITGKGANGLLIDDAVKSRGEADSETIRESLWDWYTNDAYTRLENAKSWIVLIGTRWHEDDLIGRALNSADTWEVINLPALAEADDPLGRQVGEALWPAKQSAAELRHIQATIGARAWESLFQQRPAPAEGAIFKRPWWQTYGGPAPDCDWVVTAWDTAFKEGQDADYSVAVTLGGLGSDIYVIDVWRERVAFPDLKRAVANLYLRWLPDVVVVEDAASGQSLIQELKGSVQFDRPWDRDRVIPVVPFRPDRDKVARAYAVTPALEAHRVFLPAQAPWREGFEAELASFPAGKYDDQVDAFVMAMLNLTRRLRTLRPGAGMAEYFADMPGWEGERW